MSYVIAPDGRRPLNEGVFEEISKEHFQRRLGHLVGALVSSHAFHQEATNQLNSLHDEHEKLLNGGTTLPNTPEAHDHLAWYRAARAKHKAATEELAIATAKVVAHHNSQNSDQK